MGAVDFWSDPVQTRTRVWDSAKQLNKLGWLNPGDIVYVKELWPDGPDPQWARFVDYKIAPNNELEVEPWREDTKKEWWVAVDAFYADEEEPPVEEPVSWFVRFIRWILSLFGVN